MPLLSVCIPKFSLLQYLAFFSPRFYSSSYLRVWLHHAHFRKFSLSRSLASHPFKSLVSLCLWLHYGSPPLPYLLSFPLKLDQPSLSRLWNNSIHLFFKVSPCHIVSIASFWSQLILYTLFSRLYLSTNFWLRVPKSFRWSVVSVAPSPLWAL